MPSQSAPSIKNLCCPSARRIDCNSVNFIVDQPTNTLVLDASQGSLCNVVIKNSVQNIIVEGNKNSYVSVVFAPFQSVANSIVSTLGDGSKNLFPSAHSSDPGTGTVFENFVDNNLTSTFSTPPHYQINTLTVKNINKFEILGVAKGVGFGTVVSNAKYFTLNQTKNLLDYSGMSLPASLTQLCNSLSSYWQKLLTSDTFIVGEFRNYGHFLVKTKDLGGISLPPSIKGSDTGGLLSCSTSSGNGNGRTTKSHKKHWLTNVLVRCSLSSTGRNKNFRIPEGILYLWTGAKVRLCNVSCECVSGPEACQCFDAVCYDKDATNVPFVRCVTVVCGFEELGQNKVQNKCIVSANECTDGVIAPGKSKFLDEEWCGVDIKLTSFTYSNNSANNSPLSVNILALTLQEAWNNPDGVKLEGQDRHHLISSLSSCKLKDVDTPLYFLKWVQANSQYSSSCDWYPYILAGKSKSHAIGLGNYFKVDNSECFSNCTGTDSNSSCLASDQTSNICDGLYYIDPCVSYRLPKLFGCLDVNPCFLNKAELSIRCSDLVICEMVKRVWCAELSHGCPQSCQWDNSLTFQKKKDNTEQKALLVNSYLIKLDVDTPALYFGNELVGDSAFDCSNINAQRIVLSQYVAPGLKPLNNPPYQLSCQNIEKNYSYAIMFSKCKDDPVIDKKTALPRRCSPLTNEFAVVDIVRPYAGRQFNPKKLLPYCVLENNAKTTAYTGCNPVPTCDISGGQVYYQNYNTETSTIYGGVTTRNIPGPSVGDLEMCWTSGGCNLDN